MADKHDQQDEQQEQTVPLTTDEMLQQLLAQRAEDRAAIASLRDEINKAKAPVPQVSSVALSEEQLHAARMEAINAHDFYCPGCGALYDRQRECTGRGEAPHPAIEVISTDELRGNDPSKHTAAPGVNP